MKNQQHKLRHLSELEENLKKYDYPVNIITNRIKTDQENPQNELYHLFLYLIRIIHLYITQLRITLKS